MSIIERKLYKISERVRRLEQKYKFRKPYSEPSETDLSCYAGDDNNYLFEVDLIDMTILNSKNIGYYIYHGLKKIGNYLYANAYTEEILKIDLNLNVIEASVPVNARYSYWIDSDNTYLYIPCDRDGAAVTSPRILRWQIEPFQEVDALTLSPIAGYTPNACRSCLVNGNILIAGGQIPDATNSAAIWIIDLPSWSIIGSYSYSSLCPGNSYVGPVGAMCKDANYIYAFANYAAYYKLNKTNYSVVDFTYPANCVQGQFPRYEPVALSNIALVCPNDYYLYEINIAFDPDPIGTTISVPNIVHSTDYTSALERFVLGAGNKVYKYDYSTNTFDGTLTLGVGDVKAIHVT